MRHPVPLPARPAKAAARRMLTAALVLSPVRPAADPRQDPDPGSPPSSTPAAALRLPTIPARLCLQAASRGPTPKSFPAAAQQQDPITQGSSRRGPVPPAGGAGGRAGPDLLILLFPLQPLSQACSLRLFPRPKRMFAVKIVTWILPGQGQLSAVAKNKRIYQK